MLKKIVTVIQFMSVIAFFVFIYTGIAMWTVGFYDIIGIPALVAGGLMLTMVTGLLFTMIEELYS